MLPFVNALGSAALSLAMPRSHNHFSPVCSCSISALSTGKDTFLAAFANRLSRFSSYVSSAQACRKLSMTPRWKRVTLTTGGGGGVEEEA